MKYDTTQKNSMTRIFFLARSKTVHERKTNGQLVFQQFFLREVIIYETLNHGLTKLISLAYQVFKSTLMILRAPYPENDNTRYKRKKPRKNSNVAVSSLIKFQARASCENR